MNEEAYRAAMEELRKKQQAYSFFLNKRGNRDTLVLCLRIKRVWLRAITYNGLELYRYSPNIECTDQTLGTLDLENFTH